MVVGALSKGPIRYNEIGRRVQGISQRMLTLTLKGLEQDGFGHPNDVSNDSTRVDYELTKLGRKLIVPLKALSKWARENDRRCWPHARRFREEDNTARHTRALPSRNRPSAHASQNWMNSVIEYQKAVECVQHDSVKLRLDTQ